MGKISDWWADVNDGDKIEKFEMELRRKEGQIFAHALTRKPVMAFEWIINGFGLIMFGAGIALASVVISTDETPWVLWVGLGAIILGYLMEVRVNWGYKYKRST